jgi:hypothetical protein
MGVFWRPLLFCRKGGQAVAKIRDILEYKRKKEKEKEKEKEPISFAEHLERARERLREQPPRARGKPADVLTFEEVRRLMGDVGPRRFLKDRGNRRK